MRHEVPTEYAFLFGVLLIAHARAYIGQRVRLDLATGCWVWTGCKDGKYGRAQFLGMEFKAHRLAFLAFVGRIPRGRVIDHKHCDRPPCCCPHHLEDVTQKQNMRRCWATGRGYTPFRKQEESCNATVHD